MKALTYKRDHAARLAAARCDSGHVHLVNAGHTDQPGYDGRHCPECQKTRGVSMAWDYALVTGLVAPGLALTASRREWREFHRDVFEYQQSTGCAGRGARY